MNLTKFLPGRTVITRFVERTAVVAASAVVADWLHLVATSPLLKGSVVYVVLHTAADYLNKNIPNV